MPRAERIRKLEAIIISHREFGEADRFVKFFSRENGKMEAIAKGVRKPRSRKAAHLEPFTHVALVLAKGQSVWIITQAEMISPFNAIRDDLRRTARAAYILELADHLTTEDQMESAVFRLILAALKRIDSPADPFNALCHFELNLLGSCGFQPEFFKCVGCARDILPQDQFYSARLGGVLCPACATLSGDAEPLDQPALRYLRHFSRSSFQELARLKVPELVQKDMRRVITHHINFVTERHLNSPAFIHHIEQLLPETAVDD